MIKVSMILSCYNAEEYIEKALTSIINQTYTDWELIFVNDGSTDRSLEIANKILTEENRAKITSKTNGGLQTARLHGLKYVSSTSIALIFLDADDILHKDMIEILYKELSNNQFLGAVYCDHLKIDKLDQIINQRNYGHRVLYTLFGFKILPDNEQRTSFSTIILGRNKMLEALTLIRKEAYFETSGWDQENFGKGQSIGESSILFGEIALVWDVKYINIPLYYYRIHDNQITANLGSKTVGLNEKIKTIWTKKTEKDKRLQLFIRVIFQVDKLRSPLIALKMSFKHLLVNNPSKLFLDSIIASTKFLISQYLSIYLLLLTKYRNLR